MNPQPTSSGTPDIEGAIGLLRSEDSQLRQFVAYLLGQAGDPRAIEPLIDALQDEHPGVRGAAANALGKIGDPAAIPYLKPLLRQPNLQLAIWAAYALTRLGHDCFDVIEAGVQAEAVDVRRSAILALQQLGDSRAIPALLGVSRDPARRFEGDTTVGEAAQRALVHLGYNIGTLPP